MGFIRRHLGVWALAWLSCQVASLSLVAPVWQVVSQTAECLGTKADDACPMRDADGQACPMHDGSNQPDAKEQCAMRGLSHDPAIALAAFFSIPAVLIAESSISPDTQTAMLRTDLVHFTGAAVSVESPPPRS